MQRNYNKLQLVMERITKSTVLVQIHHFFAEDWCLTFLLRIAFISCHQPSIPSLLYILVDPKTQSLSNNVLHCDDLNSGDYFFMVGAKHTDATSETKKPAHLRSTVTKAPSNISMHMSTRDVGYGSVLICWQHQTSPCSRLFEDRLRQKKYHSLFQPNCSMAPNRSACTLSYCHSMKRITVFTTRLHW